MSYFSSAIVGAGASGIVAAISAARRNESVVICERMDRPGKKILASGSGRCNLSNEELDESYYNPASRALVKSVFAGFGRNEIRNFFKELGLELYSEEGRVFPVTNQSSSVLKVLEIELKNLNVPIELDFDVADISHSSGCFILTSKSGKRIESGSVVLGAGGRSYPALGSDGSAYAFAERFGHALVEPVPVAVSVVVKDALCHLLQGQRISASAKALIDGRYTGKSPGELIFTKYGLSGTAILDISEEISVAINRHGKKDVYVSIDLVPFMDNEVLVNELNRRIKRKVLAEDMLVGLLPNKFAKALKDLCHDRKPEVIAHTLKDKRFRVSGTRGWNEAEFTAGGIDVGKVKKGTLESSLKKGLYFAGEILDVNGKRGGYNLAWAWASGFVAGKTS